MRKIWPRKKKKCRPLEVQHELERMTDEQFGEVVEKANIKEKMKNVSTEL